MRARILIAVCVFAATAHAQPAKPTDAECRAFMDDGLKKTNNDEARELFHKARVQCGNPVSLVMIARTYEQQGDLPRALAYVEEFLRVADPNHEARAAVEKAAATFRGQVPAEQRVSIAAELAAKGAVAPPPPAPPPSTPPTPISNTTVKNTTTAKSKLAGQVEGFDYATHNYGGKPKIQRARGFFVGANLAYAPMAKVSVTTERMSGTVDFPAVFAAEAQIGYRIRPYLSVALVPQMLFNLKPDGEDSAREFELFAQATGHLVVWPQWDLNLFAAPGYSILMVPGADDAKGLALRYGGGPMFHFTDKISFGAELGHQLGFQKRGDVDMKTSFFSLLAGVRFRL